MAEPMYANVQKLPPKVNLSASVRDQLVQLILVGTLKSGDRINEVHIASSLGVSRGPVREAARELEGQGLFVSRPNQGFYVATFLRREIVDLYEIKDWIDGAIAHDMAKYAKPGIVRTIVSDIGSIDTRSTIAFAESLFAFRVRMIEHLHNRLLAEHALNLYRKFLLVTALVIVDDAPERMTRLTTAVRDFWTAVAQGEPGLATAQMVKENKVWCEDVAARFPRDEEKQAS